MKNKTRTIIIAVLIAVFLGVATNIAHAKFEFSARIGYFEPNDNYFESFYKKGLIYGVYGGWIHAKGVGVQAGADLYFNNFRYNEREHSVLLSSTTVSCIYVPLQNEIATPIFGVGWGWYHLSDYSMFNAKKYSNNSLGYHAVGGVRFNIYKGLFSDLQIKYSYSRSETISNINVGGWTSTLGVGYSF